MQEKTFKELLAVPHSIFDENVDQRSYFEHSKLEEMEKVVSIVIINLIKDKHSAFEQFLIALKKSGSHQNLVQKLGE